MQKFWQQKNNIFVTHFLGYWATHWYYSSIYCNFSLICRPLNVLPMETRFGGSCFHTLHPHSNIFATPINERRKRCPSQISTKLYKSKFFPTKPKFLLTNFLKLAVEAVGNVRTVVSLGCEEIFYQEYITALTPHHKRTLRNSHFRALVLGLARSLMFFAYSACMYYGGYLIRDGLPYQDVFK